MLMTALVTKEKCTPFKARIAFEDDTKTRLNELEQRSEDIESKIEVRLGNLERSMQSSTVLREAVVEVNDSLKEHISVFLWCYYFIWLWFSLLFKLSRIHGVGG
jgi:hypothetical protein